jgi:hypothetical protein
MKNFKIGNIVKVKMLQNAQYGSHWGQDGIIPIGTIGKITEIDNDFRSYRGLHRIEVIFYVKKVDLNRNKWKDFRKNQEFLFQNIYKIIHYFQKKELIRANEKEAEWFKEMEESYFSIKLAEKL